MRMNGNYENLPDDKLIEITRAGDENARDFLIKKYKSAVIAKAGAYFITGADRDDLIQEGMIGLFNATRDFETGKGAFSPFAELCVERRIISAVRAATRKKHGPLNSSLPYEAGGANLTFSPDANDRAISKNPEEVVISREGRERIENIIRMELSKLERAVMILVFEGRSYAEISKALGVNEKTVDNAIQRARRKIGTGVAKG